MKLNPILGYNDLMLPADLGQNANPPGIICAANEVRFTSTYFSEPLTAYTVGWQDPETLEAILDELFPSIEVPRRFEWKKSENAQEFLSETDDIRAIGSPFKRVETAGSSVTDKTVALVAAAIDRPCQPAVRVATCRARRSKPAPPDRRPCP